MIYPDRVTACCGAPVRSWHGQGDTVADEGTCHKCEVDLCSHCAAVFEVEGGYGPDGQGTRTFALCEPCDAARYRELDRP